MKHDGDTKNIKLGECTIWLGGAEAGRVYNVEVIMKTPCMCRICAARPSHLQKPTSHQIYGTWPSPVALAVSARDVEVSLQNARGFAVKIWRADFFVYPDGRMSISAQHDASHPNSPFGFLYRLCRPSGMRKAATNPRDIIERGKQNLVRGLDGHWN